MQRWEYRVVSLRDQQYTAALNEFGREGWELVSSTVERTAVAPAQGYQTAGVPIATTQIFKRSAE